MLQKKNSCVFSFNKQNAWKERILLIITIDHYIFFVFTLPIKKWLMICPL